MKLKLIVTSVILASAAVSAHADQQSMQTQLDAMKAQIAQMQATMNSNNASANAPSDDWFKRISIGGLLNVQGNYANRSPVTYNYFGAPATADKNTSASNIVIPNANVFVDADVSDWTKAHIGLVYGNQNQEFDLIRAGAYTAPEYASTANPVRVDEAYATIGNFAKSPIYAKLGKQFLPFGDYKPYQDMTTSLTQILSQVNATAADVGFVATNGFNGALYLLDGAQKASRSYTNQVRNFGAKLGFGNKVNDLNYNIDLGYIRNMADVVGVRYTLGNDQQNSGYYTNATSGMSAGAAIKYRAFDADAKWVGALSKFSPQDLSYPSTAEVTPTTTGAKPAAWGVDAGYSFPVMNHDTRFGLGYQGSKQASDLNLTTAGADMPKTRYLADYTVNVSKYTDLGFEVRHDNDYGLSVGGSGRNATTGSARVAVKFA